MALVGLGALLVSGDRRTAAVNPQLRPRRRDWQAFQKTVQPFLAKHCFDCHTDKQTWRRTARPVRTRRRCAKRSPTLEKVLDVLAQARHAAQEAAASPATRNSSRCSPGWKAYVDTHSSEQTARSDRVLIRRLNRAEYNNTVRDLLGVDFRPADDFPADAPGHGFDNIGGTLSVSPVLMEKYLAAAEKVARTAVFGVEPMKPERVVHQPFFTADAFSKNNEVKFDYDETGMSLPSALHVVQRFAADGRVHLPGHPARRPARRLRPRGAGVLDRRQDGPPGQDRRSRPRSKPDGRRGTERPVGGVSHAGEGRRTLAVGHHSAHVRGASRRLQGPETREPARARPSSPSAASSVSLACGR